MRSFSVKCVISFDIKCYETICTFLDISFINVIFVKIIISILKFCEICGKPLNKRAFRLLQNEFGC